MLSDIDGLGERQRLRTTVAGTSAMHATSVHCLNDVALMAIAAPHTATTHAERIIVFAFSESMRRLSLSDGSLAVPDCTSEVCPTSRVGGRMREGTRWPTGVQ